MKIESERRKLLRVTVSNIQFFSGILYIIFSIIGILAAIITFTAVVGGGILSGDEEAMAVTSIVVTAIAFFLTITALPGLIGGFGLLKHKQWARILIIIIGCLNLINIPIGTCLGVYTLWALLNKETESLFV